MKKGKHIAMVAGFFAIIFSMLLGFFVLPVTELSLTERRKLAQMPEFTWESLLAGKYMVDLEKYSQDQFPLREEYRSLKAVTQYYLLGILDSNDIYLEDGSAIKMEKTLKEDEIVYLAEKISALVASFPEDVTAYTAVIPDKQYFSTENRPSLDYEKMMSLYLSSLEGVTYVDIFEDLSLEDYYLSDSHWKQDALEEVRNTLAFAMGVGDSMLPFDEYTVETYVGFTGVYLGQSALPVERDSIDYLLSDATQNAIVTSAEISGFLPVYDLDKTGNMDDYDLFLQGAQAIITMENPYATTEKELVIFRDSFGSSIAPLFLEGYSKITLVDLRYVSASYLENFVTFESQDVLFLYSTTMLNSGKLQRF